MPGLDGLDFGAEAIEAISEPETPATPSPLSEVVKLKAELARLRKENESLRGRVIGENWKRRFVMMNIAFAFAAGGIFVLADTMWQGDNPFVAGVFYAVGVVLLLLAVPALHASGSIRYVEYKLWQPLQGGIRFVVLQALSWSFYAMAILALVAAVWWGEQAVGLVSSGGILGILSQVLMASSLQTFVSPTTQEPRLQRSHSVSSIHRHATLPLDDEDEEPQSGPLATNDKMESFAQLITLNAVLVVIVVVLSIASEMAGTVLPAALSLLVTLVVVLLTHGLGGRLKWGHGWSFFQPFTGGTQFVVLQAFTWLLFSVSLLCQATFLIGAVYWGLKFTTGLMHLGGMTAVACEILLVISFRYFKKKDSTAKLRDEVLESHVLPEGADLELSDLSLPKETLAMFIVTAMVFNTQFIPFGIQIFIALVPYIYPSPELTRLTGGVYYEPWKVMSTEEITIPYVVMTIIMQDAAVIVTSSAYSGMRTLGVSPFIEKLMSPPWMILLHLYFVRNSELFPMVSVMAAVWGAYFLSFQGGPEWGNRTREWPRFRRWKWFWENLRMYFGGRVLVSSEVEALAAQGKGPGQKGTTPQQYLIGFHPHGIMPASMVWSYQSEEWSERLPGLHGLTPLTASIMHFIPMMRDLNQYAGGREVSSKSVLHTLSQGRTPIIVVGGQAEMFRSRSKDKEIAIVKYHDGFFRIGIRKGVPLLPIFSFAETKFMDNVDIPLMQQWFKDRIGFPIPFIPYGRWCLPLPRRRKALIVVGKPIEPPALAPGSEPTPDQIREVKTQYFDELQRLFDEFKVRAGYADHTLNFLESRQSH